MPLFFLFLNGISLELHTEIHRIKCSRVAHYFSFMYTVCTLYSVHCVNINSICICVISREISLKRKEKKSHVRFTTVSSKPPSQLDTLDIKIWNHVFWDTLYNTGCPNKYRNSVTTFISSLIHAAIFHEHNYCSIPA